MAHEWKTVRMSAELVEQIDAVRGQVPLSRWVARCCEAGLSGGTAIVARAENRIAESAGRPGPRRATDDAALARQAALNKRKGM